LTCTRTYNQIAAAFLLAVYTFIVTPTGFWHRHASGKPVSAVVSSTEEFSVGHTGSFTDDCPICAHQYAVYTSDTTFFWQLLQQLLSDTDDFFISRLISQPLFTHANKGPPVLS